MNQTLLRMAVFSLPAIMLAAPVSAQEALKRKTTLPPSAELTYSIEARQSGISVNGEAVLKWNVLQGRYSIATETRAMLVGKIHEARSEGTIDDFGLAPERFVEKRLRKDPTTTTFDRAAKKISFTESDVVYPIKGGEQDRSSVVWQLASIARGAPAKFKVGTEWKFLVAGRRDAEPWTFKVVKQEKVHIRDGDVPAFHIVRSPPPDAKGQKLDLWLAPSLDWYPVRLRFTDADGDYIEQTLDHAAK